MTPERQELAGLCARISHAAVSLRLATQLEILASTIPGQLDDLAMCWTFSIMLGLDELAVMITEYPAAYAHCLRHGFEVFESDADVRRIERGWSK
jgi:hypothetical protein